MSSKSPSLSLLYRLMLAALSLGLSAESALALDPCRECLDRKANICAEECALVPPERASECHKTCVSQYCSHRCEEGDPALKSVMTKDCDSCLDQQFNLCTPGCKNGSDRNRALCRLECAHERCKPQCEKTEAPKPSSPPPATGKK